MTTPCVLACIDGSKSTPAVCDYSAWASRQLQAPLTLLHVLDHEPSPVQQDLSGSIGLGSREHLLNELADLDEKRAKLMREQGRLLLEAATDRVIQAGAIEPATRQRHGALVDTLVGLEENIRLLVIGRQGEMGDSLGDHIGTHLESVVRTMHRPVLVTAGEFRTPRSVMLAFDNGPSTRKGVEMIAASPLFRGLPVHLVMVGADTNDAWEPVRAAQKQLETQGFEVHAAIRAGDVETALLDYEQTQDIDMIVMGAYGHSRIRQFFVGSTTTNMLARTKRPLLLLR